MKVCTSCQLEKPNKSFSKNLAKADLLSAKCKMCLSEYRKKLRAANPNIYRSQWKRNKYSGKKESERRRLLSSYGITPHIKAVYSNLIKNECEICSKKVFLVIDHDHNQGGFRGLLCNTCNRGLGHFGDNIEALEKALDYLKRKKYD